MLDDLCEASLLVLEERYFLLQLFKLRRGRGNSPQGGRLRPIAVERHLTRSPAGATKEKSADTEGDR